MTIANRDTPYANPRYVRRPEGESEAMKPALLLMASVGLAGAQVSHSDEEFYRYLENRQQMAIVEAQARAWAREQALFKPIEIDEELEKEVDEVLDQRVREAVEWFKRNPRW